MAIVLEHISKHYHEKTVVRQVSLDIGEGQFTAFIGPNGAGKSNLLGSIRRLMKPDAGQVMLDGENLQQMTNAEIAKKMAILKQANHTELRLSVEDLVAFGRFPYSHAHLTAQDHQMIDQSTQYMELEPMRHQQRHRK